MAKTKYDYSPRDLKILAKALEPLTSLIDCLGQDNITHSTEILIRLNYQFLGNCLQALNFSSLVNDLELKELIFWARAEDSNRNRHLFDRMDTAHETSLSRLLDRSYSIVHHKNRWQEECKALISLIRSRLPADLQTDRQPMAVDASFDLAPLPQFRSNTIEENYIGNIWQALMIMDTIDARVHALPNRVIVLMLNQIISNNLKELSKRGHQLCGEQLFETIRNNRNCIAHAQTLSSLIGEVLPRYFNDMYRNPCQSLVEIIRPLAQPLIRLAAAEDHVAAPLEDEEKGAESSEQDNAPVLISPRLQANLELFAELQKIGLIDQAKEPRQDIDGKIFSDTELWHILETLIKKDLFNLFSQILDNLKLYTDIKVKSFINTPVLYNRDNSGKAHRTPGGLDALLYLPARESDYFRIDGIGLSCSRELVKAKAYPGIWYVHLLEASLTHEYYHRDVFITAHTLKVQSMCEVKPSLVSQHRQENIFLNKLLSLGVNLNIEIVTNTGIQPLLFSALTNAGVPLVSLLISHGAYPDVDDGLRDTLLSAVAHYQHGVTLINQLMALGVDPRKEIITTTCKANTLILMVTSSKYIEENTYPSLRSAVNLIVYKYGFNALKTILESKLESAGKKRPLAEAINFLKESKAKCKTLFSILLGLNKTIDCCELFKIILTNNLEVVQDFLEDKSVDERRSLMSETFTCTMRNDIAEINIISFAKVVCSLEVQQYLMRLKLELSGIAIKKVVVESKEEKGGPDDMPELIYLPPLTAEVLGISSGSTNSAAEAGVLPVSLHNPTSTVVRMRSGTSLDALPSTATEANVVGNVNIADTPRATRCKQLTDYCVLL